MAAPREVASTPDALALDPRELARRVIALEAFIRHMQAGPRVYSQLDGERPAGISRDHYLRVCRDHADELRVTRRGKARLVAADAWEAWVTAQAAKIPEAPESGQRSIADTVLDELGGVRGDD